MIIASFSKHSWEEQNYFELTTRSSSVVWKITKDHREHPRPRSSSASRRRASRPSPTLRTFAREQLRIMTIAAALFQDARCSFLSSRRQFGPHSWPTESDGIKSARAPPFRKSNSGAAPQKEGDSARWRRHGRTSGRLHGPLITIICRPMQWYFLAEPRLLSSSPVVPTI